MGNSASALPYSIGAQVDESDGWIVSEGSQKSDGAAVTVFVAHKPQLGGRFDVARHHFVNCKRLRHPHLLNVHATLDTDAPGGDAATTDTAKQPASSKGDWIVVTEPCISLDKWLQTAPSPPELAWGLQCMVEALSFLHTSANLAHGNLSPSSWKVTPAGDVKLWNYSLVTGKEISSHFRHYESTVTPTPYRSPERGQGNYDALANAGLHAMDSYGLGVLISSELYPGTPPQSLQKALQRLLTPSIKMRPRLAPLLKCPLFQTDYAKLQVALQELPVQNVDEKTQFWHDLLKKLESNQVSQRVAQFKLLPLLKNSIDTICTTDSLIRQDTYKRELAAMLPCLFKIWELYPESNDDEASLDFSATIAHLFGVADRGLRYTLLTRTSLLFSKLKDPAMANKSMFEPMCSGFQDNAHPLRELTLKSCLPLMSSLTPPNLEKLSRYLVRLQGDPEASIRTNAIVLIVKVAPLLGDVQREKLLLPAIQRGLRDNFIHCRLASLGGVENYQDFSPTDLATKVLPTVAPLLVDNVTEVRTKALAVVDMCVSRLKQKHVDLQQQQQAQAQQQQAPMDGTAAAPAPSTTAPPAAPSSGSGYLSGLSSWMTSSAKPTDTSAPPMAATAAQPPMHPPQQQPPAPQPVASLQTNLKATNLDGWGDDEDNWDDDNKDENCWGDEDDGWGDDNLSPATKKPTMQAKPAMQAMSNKEEEDFFKSFDSKPAKPALRGTGKLVVPNKKKTKQQQAPAVTKLKVDASDWDDF